MAIGGSAGLTQSAVNQQILQDATYLRSVYDWVTKKYSEYNANLSTTNQQTGAGFSAAPDQNQINVFIADLNRVKTLFEGGTPTTSNIVNDLGTVLGIS
jgi:hypothetical protein